MTTTTNFLKEIRGETHAAIVKAEQELERQTKRMKMLNAIIWNLERLRPLNVTVWTCGECKNVTYLESTFQIEPTNCPKCGIDNPSYPCPNTSVVAT